MWSGDEVFMVNANAEGSSEDADFLRLIVPFELEICDRFGPETPK